MGVSFKHWSGGIALATLILAGNNVVLAEQTNLQEKPLRQSSIPEILDQQSKLDDYWVDQSLGGDANFAFSVDTSERKIRNASERVEAIYKDLIQEQDDDFPTMRTRDLENPYVTSLLELQSLSGAGNSEAEEPAAPPIPEYNPLPASPVPALW
ncbi:MAG: hypothetical protein HC851_16435 [Acaryochloris sp. RU_4_1]|nr:hypothetical protein [Acaryochloris sp. RU_4_1]NJR55734.1 hypothetical protein [Acaryochloris sp. CRU_2_0]